jgi:hypothetical protein
MRLNLSLKGLVLGKLGVGVRVKAVLMMMCSPHLPKQRTTTPTTKTS